MARIVYPTGFLKRTVLFQNIKEKHDADGPASPLIPFLIQQDIDLGSDEAATNKAIKKNTLFEKTARAAEDNTQERNNLFNPVFGRLREMVQFLKKHYAGNVKELGRWGVQVDGRRIVYPADILRRAELFSTFKARHDALGAASPLLQFITQQGIDMAADGADVIKAEGKHDQMQQAKRDAEKYREKRDNLFNPVMKHMRGIGQYLKGLYIDNPKELGHWGYTVDDSPRKGRKATVMILPGSTFTVRRLLNGKALTNTSHVELILHKGRAEGKEGVNLPPGESITITQGWGNTTVVNTEQRQVATISVEKIS